MLALLCGAWSIMSAANVGNVTVKVLPHEDWDNDMYLWVWPDGGNGEFKEMSLSDGWYSCTIAKGLNFLFVDGQSWEHQTVNITGVTVDEICYEILDEYESNGFHNVNKVATIDCDNAQSTMFQLSVSAKFTANNQTISTQQEGYDIYVEIDEDADGFYDDIFYSSDMEFASTGIISLSLEEGTIVRLGYEKDEEVDDFYSFTSWSNGDTKNPITLEINSDLSITANFLEAKTYTLSVDIPIVNDEIVGYVDIYKFNTESQQYEEFESTADYEMDGNKIELTVIENTQLMLTAELYEGYESEYRFTGWSNGATESSTTLTMTKNTTLNAIFEELPIYKVSLSSSDRFMGFVSCKTAYDYEPVYSTTKDGSLELEVREGDIIKISADVYSQSIMVGNYYYNAQYISFFAGWSDFENSQDTKTRDIVVTSDTAIVANFSYFMKHIQLSVNDHEMGYITAQVQEFDFENGGFKEGQNYSTKDNQESIDIEVRVSDNVNIIAQEREKEEGVSDYVFTGWTGEGLEESVEYYGNVISGIFADVNLTAQFVKAIHNLTINISDYTAGYVEAFQYYGGSTPIASSYGKKEPLTLQVRYDEPIYLNASLYTEFPEIVNDYNFTGWSDGEKETYREIYLDKDSVITANFNKVPKYNVTISASDLNVAWVTVYNYTTNESVSSRQSKQPIVLQVKEGAELSLTTGKYYDDENYIKESALYYFDKWSDDVQWDHHVVITSDTTFVAQYKKYEVYTISVSANDYNIGYVEVSGQLFNPETNAIESMTVSSFESHDKVVVYVRENETPLLRISANIYEDKQSSCSFKEWSDGNTDPVRMETLTGNLTLEATFVGTHSAVENLENDPSKNIRKVIIDGQLYIITPDGKRYNALGAEIR